MSDLTVERRHLDVLRELVEWSSLEGHRGDYAKLWRRHDAILGSLYDDARPSPERAASHLRQLEIDGWLDVLHGSLLPERLSELAALRGTRGVRGSSRHGSIPRARGSSSSLAGHGGSQHVSDC